MGTPLRLPPALEFSEAHIERNRQGMLHPEQRAALLAALGAQDARNRRAAKMGCALALSIAVLAGAAAIVVAFAVHPRDSAVVVRVLLVGLALLSIPSLVAVLGWRSARAAGFEDRLEAIEGELSKRVVSTRAGPIYQLGIGDFYVPLPHATWVEAPEGSSARAYVVPSATTTPLRGLLSIELV